MVKIGVFHRNMKKHVIYVYKYFKITLALICIKDLNVK